MGNFTLESASIDVLGIGLCTVGLLFAVPKFDHSTRASQFMRQGGGPAATALVTFACSGKSPAESASSLPDRKAVANSLRATSAKKSSPPRVSSIWKTADATYMQAAIWASEAGRIVVFDGTWMHEGLETFLPWIDVPVVSEPLMCRWLPELSPADVVKKLSEHSAHLSVYTRGARGCVTHWDNETHLFHTFPKELVDTTGAVDALHGAVPYGLYRQWASEQTIRFVSLRLRPHRSARMR